MHSKKQTMWRHNTEGASVRRHVLKDMLPLDTPISIEIEPASPCCLKCVYCPHSLDPEQKKRANIGQGGIMDFALFEEIVKQCKDFPGRIKNIRFTGFGEPLLNPKLPEMISLIKREDIAETVTIFTNAVPLTHQISESLVKAGVDTFLIDIQGFSAEDYLAVANVKIDYDRLYDNIKFLYGLPNRGKIFIKVLHFIARGREEKFFELYEPYCDEMSIQFAGEIHPEIDYSGMLTGRDETCGIEFASSEYCAYPWYMMSVSARGEVTACCMAVAKGCSDLHIGAISPRGGGQPHGYLGRKKAK